MQAAYRRTSETHRFLPALEKGIADSLPGGALFAPLSDERSVYGQRRRPNWAVIAGLALGHAALLGALVKFDVIPITAAPKPVVMELIQVPEMAPPPPEPVQPMPEVTKPELVIPDPVIVPPLPVASPLQAAIQPPRPVEIAAPPIKAEGTPAPVTPPDFTADYLNNPAPRYPVESRRLREQGTVTIRVLVSPEGSVQEIKLADSSGHSRLDKAALSAVRGWRFAPAKQAGKPVAAWVIVPIPFILQV